MKYIDEYRDPQRARLLIAEIRSRASQRWVLMEVCGGQTHSLLRHGIAEELRNDIELIHGPGCPVCVTPAAAIDLAQSIAMQPKTTLVSFGDMVRVPGTQSSLLEIRTRGGSTKTVYSPLDAVELARRNRNEHYVFFAVGFETTAPATALAVLQADQLGLTNFSILVAHVRVQPAMEAILRSPNNRVQAFLAAGHVCTVAGFESYSDLSKKMDTPIVVTGFEPLDLLEGILACVIQLENGQYSVENRYARCAVEAGNIEAQQVIDRVYEVADRPWRGLGEIANGGYILKHKWQRFDAAHRFAHLQNESTLPIIDLENECQAAEVLSGRLRPTECSAFGKECTPDLPLGAPMVSSEGACAAYFRFGPKETVLSQGNQH
ncbi:MAG: hydrogenase formation protein HypD [Fuerstiella sp.]